MGDIKTVVRTEVDINGRSYFLAPGQDPGDVKRRIQEAEQGTFVELMVVGGRSVSVLMSSGTQVVVTTETVEVESEGGEPYDTGFDAF
ncbi:hypothetical protein ACH0AH_09770 [Microbacterium paludicola]|uniref:hypothetical protein n=1 Tax=Microbacterium paludicola TaxID=300019 RepID=UPI00387A3CE5